MPITCRVSGLAILLLAKTACLAQGLEDKVSQSRRLQAQSMLGADQQALDSLLQERRGQTSGAMGTLPSRKPPAREPLDSLLWGPEMAGPEDSAFPSYTSDLDPLAPDGYESGDSAQGLQEKRGKAQGARRATRKPRIPARYEQRIFTSLDRSAFGSAYGSAGRDYVLGPGDQITVSLWGDREKEYNLVLNHDGAVFMEGVGLVPLGGLSLSDAQDRLRARLTKVFSGISRGTSHMQVTLARSGPMKVFVLGEVKVPGGYVFSGNTSVMSAMYFAKGPSDIGTVRNLLLNRGGKKYSLDLYKYLIYGERLSPDALQDGDVLFAGRADILVQVKGDVGRPATYELRKGEGVKELLEFAGHLNPTAATQKITLQRIFPDGRVDYLDLASPQEYLAGKAKFEMQDGDKVLVERSAELGKQFFTVVGPVKYPGTYSAHSIRTVQELVQKAGGLREDAFLQRVHVVRFNPDGSSQLFAYSLDSTMTGGIELKPKDNVILYSSKEMYLPDSVEIAGAVFHPARYEFREGMTAMDLVMQSGGFLPNHEAGNLLVFRGDPRERKVTQIQVASKAGMSASNGNFQLQANDIVHVPVDPRWYKKEVVVLSGQFLRPGKYALLAPGEKLVSVIERAGGFKDDAYVTGARLFRKKDSVGRVGLDFTKALRRPQSKENIAMAGGDSIFVPERLNTVKVIGEVGFETSVLHKSGAAVEYYIEKAGGFTRRSEQGHVVVEYANGETGRDGLFNRKPDAGSVIFVPQGPEPKPIDWFTGINAILGTVSIGAAILLSIQALRN